MPPSRRDELIESAMRVFDRNGFHASGLDRVLQESGISRMTLYNHFKSKDELIVAALRRRDEMIRNDLMRFVEARTDSPRGRVLAVFDFLEGWFTNKDFSGCMFINASAEFDDAQCAIRRAAADHKVEVLRYLTTLCAACGVSNPEKLAKEINLLMLGAMASARVLDQVQNNGQDPAAAARVGKDIAARLIDAAPRASMA